MQPKETPFVAWDFTPEELIVACTFNDLQLKHLQTELAIVASRKILLAYDPENPDKFRLEHEYYRGQMEIISFLLNVHETTMTEVRQRLEEDAIVARARQQQQNNNPDTAN